MTKFGLAIITFDLQGVLDHNPVLGSSGVKKARKKIPFRYKDLRSENKQFLTMVVEVWHTLIHGVAMHKLMRKLKILKDRLKELNLTEYSHLKEKTEEARFAHEVLQERLQTNNLMMIL